jgi:hypothetical protein
MSDMNTDKNGKPLSRQRLKQLGNIAAGLCQQCAAPSTGKVLCDRCAIAKHPFRKRHLTKAEWQVVDWSMRNGALAEKLNVSVCTVSNNRRKHQPRADATKTLEQAMLLLRSTAMREEASLRKAGFLGCDLPPDVRDGINRVREFVGMTPI